jgi:hypothetical protein
MIIKNYITEDYWNNTEYICEKTSIILIKVIGSSDSVCVHYIKDTNDKREFLNKEIFEIILRKLK